MIAQLRGPLVGLAPKLLVGKGPIPKLYGGVLTDAGDPLVGQEVEIQVRIRALDAHAVLL